VKKLFCLLVLSALAILPALAQTQAPVRVNCGGVQYKDASGQVWQADTGFSGGTPELTPNPVEGTPDPSLFQTYRLDPTSYSFKVADGKYQVNLYFMDGTVAAEEIGARVFNVSVQGTVVFPDLDIFAEVGANSALIKTTTASVTNGTLTIGFTPVSGLNPKISAIEILPANQTVSGPTLTLSFKYPDGTPVSGSLNYSLSSSLLSLKGSQALVNGFAECDLFANPSAMGISAQFTVILSLSDTSGHTLWQMNLEMNPAEVNLAAVQSSTLNVTVQKM
jgi:Malectin domain